MLGTRRDDPNGGEQQFFEPSSDWMPPFMRVNPILLWSYDDVWDFLRSHSLPFCSLYSDGYTSLGKVSRTVRNPALKRADGTFAPAWELADPSLERAGRVAPPKPPASPDEAAASAPPTDSEQATASQPGGASKSGGAAAERQKLVAK